MSALYLVANFFCIAGLYLLLQAQLLAVLQVVVYTGAIMVLVVFVIMLLNLGDEKRLTERFRPVMIAGIALGTGFLLEVFIVIFGSATLPAGMHASAAANGSIESMGAAMFSTFVLPFEATSVLLLVAIVGAVVLAKKRN